MRNPKSEKLDYVFNIIFQINRYCIYGFVYLFIRQIINNGFNESGEFIFHLWFYFASPFMLSTLILRAIGYKMLYKENYALIISLFLVTVIFFEIFGIY